MKRQEILGRLGYQFQEGAAKRVIICTDAHNEADDQFAITHHLLTPCEQVIGIVASHYEYMTCTIYQKAEKLGWPEERLRRHLDALRFAPLHESMDLSFEEIQRVLTLMQIGDVPVYHGARDPLRAGTDLPESEGADFIIREAQKQEAEKLYVCFLGTLTDMAVALTKCPEIADRVTIIWIGGGKYPNGEEEFNLMQDVAAANVVFRSKAEVWQIPKDVYTRVVVSFSELQRRVRPCGELGAYLVDNLFRFYRENCLGSGNVHRDAWILGDNPTVSVLAVEDFGEAYHMERAPIINSDCSYTANNDGKWIRVYKRIHERFLLEDLFAKLELCYRR